MLNIIRNMLPCSISVDVTKSTTLFRLSLAEATINLTFGPKFIGINGAHTSRTGLKTSFMLKSAKGE